MDRFIFVNAEAYLSPLLGGTSLIFDLNYSIIYFSNVYGGLENSNEKMGTVIAKFISAKKNRDSYVKITSPGIQRRYFTHINDTIKVCYQAWKKNKSRHYSISNKKSYTILEVAKLFKTPIKYLPHRKGERFASALTDMSLSNKVYKNFGKTSLKKYVDDFIRENNNNS